MKLFSFKPILALAMLLCFIAGSSFAVNTKDFPPRPSPQRLVNDLAGLLTPGQQDELEQLLVNFDNTTSTQITIVTIRSLGGYEPSEYATQLGQYWGVGRKGKNNGVVILVAAEDRKMNISPGYGLEGVLPDALCGRIIRNEMAPEFKAGNYYKGLENASTAIIAATKGEYTNEDKPGAEGQGNAWPFLIFIFILIGIIILAIIRRGGGGGGGNYMSRRGGDFITGAILGSIFNGGRGSGGGGWGSGGGSSGGGFGGFGGGSFGGGGASGSW